MAALSLVWTIGERSKPHTSPRGNQCSNCLLLLSNSYPWPLRPTAGNSRRSPRISISTRSSSSVRLRRRLHSRRQTLHCVGWPLTIGALAIAIGEGQMKRTLGSAFIAWLLAAVFSTAAEPDARGVEFFEKRIRPLLVENCFQCHGPKKQESGLALSTAAAIQQGGDRGQLFAPGEPDASLIIQAVRYTDDDLKMPPRGKLRDEQVADLVAWVKLGAPLPRDNEVELTSVKPSSDFNLAERR